MNTGVIIEVRTPSGIFAIVEVVEYDVLHNQYIVREVNDNDEVSLNDLIDEAMSAMHERER